VHTVTSHDGTTIAYDRTGAGAPVVLVVGAFNDRGTGAPLAAALADRFTVFAYDRRGRGDSGDTMPYAVDREVEDLAAVVAAAGGSAAVFGYSSGAVLALKAAQLGLPITRLALYDTPLRLDGPGDGPADGAGLAEELDELVSAGRRGEAVELFQTAAVGIPAEVVAKLRAAPFRPALEAMAHTTVYDVTITGDPAVPAGLAALPVPTLAIAGGDGPEWMVRTARAIAEAVPDGQYRILAGQTHDIVPAAVAPVLSLIWSFCREDAGQPLHSVTGVVPRRAD
jgi:pimeloyl-ACP methyl ester carboxylesterase